MGALSVRLKVLLLAVVPLVAITAVIMLVVQTQLKSLGELEIEQARSQMIDERRQALKDYIDLAISSIQGVYRDSTLPREQAQAEAKKILTDLTYNGNNYIFAYDYQGTNLVTRPKPALVGQNLMGLQDKAGRYLVRDLITIARQGGGYLEYLWSKPDGTGNGPKLSYATTLVDWQWMIGTGFMIDDIDDRMAELREDMADKIATTLWGIFAVGVAVLLVIAGGASLISGRIVAPLSSTAHAMRDIAEGEGDLTRRLDSRNADEVGEVTDGFNTFAAKIHTLVSEVKVGVTDLTSATSQMEGVVHSTHEDANLQRVETQQVAAAIHEMVAAVQQVAGNAAEAAQAASNADVRAVEGQSLVDGTIDTLSLIHI